MLFFILINCSINILNLSTTSLGSICLGSLFIACIRTVRLIKYFLINIFPNMFLLTYILKYPISYHMCISTTINACAYAWMADWLTDLRTAGCSPYAPRLSNTQATTPPSIKSNAFSTKSSKAFLA